MKKSSIVFLCVSLLHYSCGYGQQHTTYQSISDNAIYYSWLILPIGGCYFIYKAIKEKNNGTSKSSKDNTKENVNTYKNQVKTIAENMKTDAEISSQEDWLRLAFKDVKNLYESATSKYYSTAETFIKKTKKEKILYDNLRQKFLNYINKKYHSDYEEQKQGFNSNITTNIGNAKINLNKMNDLKIKLCWDDENTFIASEIDNCNYTINVWDNFQKRYIAIKQSLAHSTKPIDELKIYQKAWQTKTGISNLEMQSKIDELNTIVCQNDKSFYDSLQAECSIFEKMVVNEENRNDFNIKYISAAIDQVDKNTCIGYDKFLVLKNKFIAKDDAINEAEQKKQEEYEQNHPLDFTGFTIYPNEIGEWILHLFVHNNTDKGIDAFKCIIKYYNKFGEPVNFLFSDSNTGEITSQRTIAPYNDIGVSINLTFQEQTRKIRVTLTKVLYTDGRIWIPKKFQDIDVSPN